MSSGRHVIALIHGIRTEAAWAERVKSILEAELGAEVEPLRYGYFDLFRFLCPLGTRKGAISHVHDKLRALREYDRDRDISVIAHSFGTHIVTTILLEDPFLNLKRMILCGSIVRDTFSWPRVANQIADKKVLNECGTRDVWPVFATSVTYGYGPTGTFGFGDPKVRDRFHRSTHSGYFDEGFVKGYWVPYLGEGTIKGTSWEKERPAPPLWLSLLRFIPVRWGWWLWIPPGLWLLR